MTRTADLATAALLLLIGLIAVVDSLRLGAGWGSDGPKSGFFPFWLGTLLLVVTVVIAVQAWRRGPGKPFVTREQLRPVMQVLWPAVAMVALTAGVGLYLAPPPFPPLSIRRGGRPPRPTGGLLSLGIPALTLPGFAQWVPGSMS